jgi:predicted site-specific integrase-resolvase
VLGYDPESFWDQTQHTFELAVEAYNERFAIAHNNDVRLAWNTAGLIRVKKQPRIETLYMQSQKQKDDLDEQLEGLKNWVAATGGKVIYKQ